MKKRFNAEKQTYLYRERDTQLERQTANRAKSSRGYRARKTHPDGERERAARFFQEHKTSK